MCMGLPLQSVTSVKVIMLCFGVLYLDIKPLLTPEAVTELVMASMLHVPSTQPTAFGASYTPIAAAGADPQVRQRGLTKMCM